MNANTPENWPLASYTNNTWTDLVAEEAIVAAISISNTSAGTAIVELRVEQGGSNVASLLPATEIESATAYAVDLRSVVIKPGQALQVRCDVAGVEFFASGAIEVAESV